MTNYTKSAVKDVSITLLMSVLAAVVAYITRMILARNLGPHNYGLFSSILTFIIFFLFFRDLGLSSSLVKHIAEFKVHDQFNKIKTAIVAVLSFQFISSLLFVLALFLLSDFLSESYFRDPRAQKIIIFFSIYVLFSIFFTILKGIFRGFRKMFLFSSVEFVKNTIILILILLFFRFGIGLYAPVIAYVLVSPFLFAFYIYSALKVSRYFKNKIADFRITSKKVILFGIPLFASSFAGKIIGYIDTLFLTYFLPLSQVGIYNVILPSALILLLFGRSLTSIAFPITAELWAKKDYRKLLAGVRILHKYAFVLFIPIILTIFSFSELIIEVLFGIEYVSGAVALQILLVGMLFYVMGGINGTIISAIGKPGVIAKITIAAAAINIVANLLLIPIFGITGAASATTLSYFFILFVSTYKIKKYLRVKLPFANWIKQWSVGMVFVGTISYTKGSFDNLWMSIIIPVILSGALYIYLLFVFKLIDYKEIKKHLQLIR